MKQKRRLAQICSFCILVDKDNIYLLIYLFTFQFEIFLQRKKTRVEVINPIPAQKIFSAPIIVDRRLNYIFQIGWVQ